MTSAVKLGDTDGVGCGVECAAWGIRVCLLRWLFSEVCLLEAHNKLICVECMGCGRECSAWGTGSESAWSAAHAAAADDLAPMS
jgi:hypothetical protein